MIPFQKSKRLLSCLRRAVETYRMLTPGDRVAVGLSGGKDSLALLCALALYRRFSAVPFTLLALTVDPGFPGSDYTALSAFCEALEVPHILIKSDIFRRVFEGGGTGTAACAVCAKLRRGILLHEARERGCTALALGHHEDDAAVTFLMNLFNEGRLGCFSPVTVIPAEEGAGGEISIIRPLLYADESDIRYFVRVNRLPVTASCCPVDGRTDRERWSVLLRSLERERPGTRHRILRAMEKAKLDGFKERPSAGSER